MILVGGGLAWLYAASGTVLTAILAVNVGATAPLVLQTLASEVEIEPGKTN